MQRVTELLKVGKEKRVLKFAKWKLGIRTHKRAKKKTTSSFFRKMSSAVTMEEHIRLMTQMGGIILNSYLGEAGGRELARIISGDDNQVESYQCSPSLPVATKKVKAFDGPTDVKAIQTLKEISSIKPEINGSAPVKSPKILIVAVKKGLERLEI
ncbi:hypothetical protein Tco_1570627 [Tanacetum coccineum]